MISSSLAASCIHKLQQVHTIRYLIGPVLPSIQKSTTYIPGACRRALHLCLDCIPFHSSRQWKYAGAGERRFVCTVLTCSVLSSTAQACNYVHKSQKQKWFTYWKLKNQPEQGYSWSCAQNSHLKATSQSDPDVTATCWSGHQLGLNDTGCACYDAVPQLYLTLKMFSGVETPPVWALQSDCPVISQTMFLSYKRPLLWSLGSQHGPAALFWPADKKSQNFPGETFPGKLF